MDDEKDLGQYLVAKGVFREKSATEWVFTGFLWDQDGRYLARASGSFPSELFKLSPRKRLRRPKDEAKHVSVAGHMAMLAPIEDGKLIKTRIEVATLLHIGNSGSNHREAQPDNQNRQIRDHCTKAKDSLTRSTVLVAKGDENGKGRLIIFLERGTRITHASNGFKIDGHGWIVKWGQAKAEYGRIQAEFENPPGNSPVRAVPLATG